MIAPPKGEPGIVCYLRLWSVIVQQEPINIAKLVHDSTLIFSGTVVALGVSSVANLPPQDNFAVVRVDRLLRSDSSLDLRDKLVTVALRDRGELGSDTPAIFFTTDWIHGGGIAAREVGHINVQQEAEVAAEVALLPERHLAERLAGAALVVVAEVTRVEPTPFDVRWRNCPQWAEASLGSIEVLRGESKPGPMVLFPTSTRPTWIRSPRLKTGQRVILILRRPSDWPPLPESHPYDAFTALDPADVQPMKERPLVEKLLGQGSVR
jgi:hypothetical protein